MASPTFSSVQLSLSRVWLCDPMDSSMPGLPVHQQLPEFTQIHVHWVSDAMQPYHPRLPLLLLPSIFPSIRVFSNESALHIMWPKYWSFSFSISPSNEHSGLISLRMDWLDILAVQGTLKPSLTPQFKSINSLVLGFLYSPTLTSIHDYWKNHSLDYTDLCGTSMSLLFNMLSRLVITFLSRSKPLLISWLQSPSAVILEPPQIKSLTSCTVSPSICHEVMGPDAMILAFWMLSLSQPFHSPLSLSSRGSLVLLYFLP